MPDEQPTKLPTSSPEAPAQARAQAAEYGGLFAPSILRLDDGTELIVPPHPSLQMFDDEAQAELDQLHLELDTEYERHPDIQVPEQTIYDKKTGQVITVLPATTQRGGLIEPYRKRLPDGSYQLMNPPYKVRVAQIALGERQYALLRNGTIDGHQGSAADVWRIWNEQGVKVAEREKADSKSEAGAVDLEAVPTPDSE